MTEAPILSLDEIEDLANRALVAAGTSEEQRPPTGAGDGGNRG